MARETRMSRAWILPRGLLTLYLIGLYLSDTVKGKFCCLTLVQ